MSGQPDGRVRGEHGRNRARGLALLCCLAGALAACELPEETHEPAIEDLYLLDRIDGAPPPAPVCEQGEVAQRLHFESITLAEDGTYGRFQRSQLDDDPPIEQQETGEFERTDDAIVLRNGAGGVVTLALLDSAATFVQRIHPCGNVLRYAWTPFEG